MPGHQPAVRCGFRTRRTGTVLCTGDGESCAIQTELPLVAKAEERTAAQAVTLVELDVRSVGVAFAAGWNVWNILGASSYVRLNWMLGG